MNKLSSIYDSIAKSGIKHIQRESKTYMLKSILTLLSAVLVLFPAIADKGIESAVHGGSDEISPVGIVSNDLFCWFDGSFALVFTLLSGLDPVLSGEHSCISTSL